MAWSLFGILTLNTHVNHSVQLSKFSLQCIISTCGPLNPFYDNWIVLLIGYDAALYSAATTYYQQQQQTKTGTTWQYKGKGATTMLKTKTKQPPKPPQLHYCEVCKISCAGPQVCKILLLRICNLLSCLEHSLHSFSSVVVIFFGCFPFPGAFFKSIE